MVLTAKFSFGDSLFAYEQFCNERNYRNGKSTNFGDNHWQCDSIVLLFVPKRMQEKNWTGFVAKKNRFWTDDYFEKLVPYSVFVFSRLRVPINCVFFYFHSYSALIDWSRCLNRPNRHKSNQNQGYFIISGKVFGFDCFSLSLSYNLIVRLDRIRKQPIDSFSLWRFR